MALCPVPIDALGQLKCEGGAGGLASQTQRAPHGGPGIDWKGGGLNPPLFKHTRQFQPHPVSPFRPPKPNFGNTL